jgi:hypothetical protein
MQGDPDQFAVDVRQWVEKAKGNTNGAFQATALLALARVKELTPVDTGFLRASWTIANGSNVAGVAGADQSALEVVASLQLGDRIMLVNPAPYAMRVNFGFVGEDSLGRHYDQKGRHMVEQTISEMPEISRQAVEWVMGGGTPLSIMGLGND